MRRNCTEIMAIAAILAGAAIGATGTLAITGNPFDGTASVGLDCEYFHVSSPPMRATWIYTMDRDGEVRKKRCPRRITSTHFVRDTPLRTIDMAHQAELAALAHELAEARSRVEVVRVLESHAEARADESSGDRGAGTDDQSIIGVPPH